MKRRVPYFSMVASVLCALSPQAFATESFLAEVIALGPPPPAGSGYVPAWRKIVVERDMTKARTELLIAYEGEGQLFPTVGQRCRFDVSAQRTGGNVGEEVFSAEEFMVIDRFKCPE